MHSQRPLRGAFFIVIDQIISVKIGVLGVGALGGYYGGLLSHAGCEVHLLLRSDYEVVCNQGLQIESSGRKISSKPRVYDNPEDIGFCDLILVCLKTTANSRYKELITPLVGEQTTILCLQNGLGNYEKLAALFSEERIVGGLCFVCLNRISPGVIKHQGFGKIVLGEFGKSKNKRASRITSLLEESGIACELTDRLEEALWEKLVWNIPFNGCGVAAAAGWDSMEAGHLPRKIGMPWATDRLLNDPEWEPCIRQLMNELICTAKQKGIPMKPSLINRMIDNTRAMGAYRASTVVDFESGNPLELESMFLEPLRQAKEAKAVVPRLEALCVVLKKLAGYVPRP